MAFVDELQFSASAGKGGDGIVHWHREKYKPKMGPDGGDGGKGGDVWVRAVRDILRLSRIRHIHEYRAEDGAPGGPSSKTGRGGEDLVIDLPVGSIITEKESGKIWELTEEGQEVRILTGGAGGFGNEHFKSSTNQAPREWTPGKPGQEGKFRVELRLIADAGLVGLPNAGKSSLLNALTRADAKVGDYQFTTLDPNLGELYGLILADIPGLIEGASHGKGLGNKFLRHISRTKCLLHCISLERDNPEDDYVVIRKELENYENLGEKREVLVLTKADEATPEKIELVTKALAKHNPEKPIVVSILDPVLVKRAQDEIVRRLREAE